MHIGRVVHIFYGDTVGDPYSAFNLSQRQSMSGHRVSLFTWNKNNRRTAELINQNFKIYRLKGLNFALKPFFTDYPMIPHLGVMLERENVELVHAHSHIFLTTYIAIRTARKIGIPSVVTVTGVIAERNIAVNSLQRSFLRSMGKRIFQMSTRIVCLTRADAEEVSRLGCPLEKIRIIPNPVDAEIFKPCPEEEQCNLVVWIGRFVPEKGLEYLIEAAKHVRNSIRDVRFLLIGSGPLRNELEHLVRKKGLSNSIFFIGALEHKEIARVLTRANILAFPSLKEGMPKAVLEAMAAGKAIVASDIPGLDEIIENGVNGVLVQPKDPGALSDAIITLLEDRRSRVQLGMNARKTMLRHFSWNRVLNLLDNVYKEAAEEEKHW